MQRLIGGRHSSRLALNRFHHSGVAPVRVLLIGDRDQLVQDGPGASQAERAADRVWLTTRRGVDMDVLGDLASVLRALTDGLGSWRLWRYDVVVVVLGDGLDARARPRALQRTAELLREVLAGADDTEVLVVPPALQRERPPADSAQRLDTMIRGLTTDRARVCGAPWSDAPEERARAWAAMVGSEVARSLALAATRGGSATPALRELPDEEQARQRALDALGVVGSLPDPRLDDLVELARTAFGTESAEINFIDRDRQWKMAVAGADRGQNDRAHSFCSQTIRSPSPLVVGDARLDPVLRESPLAYGPRPIRFYAAHPIESADGYRIGSFCVYDSEPRDVRGLDLAVLRDLALLAQAELIAGDVAPVGAASRIRGA